LTESAVNLNE